MARARLPGDGLGAWATANAITFDGVEIQDRGSDSPTARGYGIFAQRDLVEEATGPLITVPHHLILSKATVREQAEHDARLKELLDAAGELAETARGVIMLYLVWQLSATLPGMAERIEVSGPWVDYTKFLGPCSLPTSWTEKQRDYLMGTSLQAAVKAKLDRLGREFEYLRRTTLDVPWCRRVWWDPEARQLTEDDWMLVDAWYRSRALSFAVAGDAMVPCIDMANHAGRRRNAYFDRGPDGNIVLRIAPYHIIRRGDEVTISYGDDKSAAEMLFSYGFIEPEMTRTPALTLALAIPEDDPLKEAKGLVSTAAAAARLSWRDDSDSTRWESSFVWLICVNEEDGLELSVQAGPDSGPRLTMSFHGHDLTRDTDRLEALLREDDRWPLYELRAIVTLFDTVQDHLRSLPLPGPAPALDEANHDTTGAAAADDDEAVRAAARRLLRQEQELLEQVAHELAQNISERCHVDVLPLMHSQR